MESQTILTTHQLAKRYGKVQAVAGLDLSVPQGSIFGILGPNGSGKTTTLGMVMGVIQPSGGKYQWMGGLDASARRQIGCLLETPNFYPYLSAEENLRIVARIKQLSDDTIAPALQTTGLYDRRHSIFRTFSLGMRQRLALAAALMGDPKVLVLDEPTNGLDPTGILEVREIIRSQAAQGRTILLASHILDEVEKVCTHVAVMKQGKLLAAGSIAEVIAGQAQLLVGTDQTDALASLLAEYPGIHRIDPGPEGLVLLRIDPELDAATLNEYLVGRGHRIHHLSKQAKRLEQHFMELITDPEGNLPRN